MNIDISVVPQASKDRALLEIIKHCFYDYETSQYDPDKELGSDELGEIVSTLDRFGLSPKSYTAWQWLRDQRDRRRLRGRK